MTERTVGWRCTQGVINGAVASGAMQVSVYPLLTVNAPVARVSRAYRR